MQLIRALYGHPDSVTFWEEDCYEDVLAVGYESLGPEWPSTFVHRELRLLLTIYVDDFKLAGPIDNLARGWAILRSRIDIGPASRDGMYLGCNVIKGDMILANGCTVRTITYDMEYALRQCLEKYLSLADGCEASEGCYTLFI